MASKGSVIPLWALRVSISAIVLVLAPIAPQTVWAEAAVSGTLAWFNTQPLPHLPVSVEDDRGSVLASGVTNVVGEFSIIDESLNVGMKYRACTTVMLEARDAAGEPLVRTALEGNEGRYLTDQDMEVGLNYALRSACVRVVAVEPPGVPVAALVGAGVAAAGLTVGGVTLTNGSDPTREVELSPAR